MNKHIAGEAREAEISSRKVDLVLTLVSVDESF